MSGPTRIVVLAGSGIDPEQLATTVWGGGTLTAGLRSAAGSDATVTVIGLGATQADGLEAVRLDAAAPLDRVLAALGGAALQRALAGSAIGRLVNTLGPLDPGRVLARRVRRSAPARAALSNADLVIAADPSAVRVAWTARRRNPQLDAVLGLGAARTLLER